MIDPAERRAQLAVALGRVQTRVAAACVAAHRDPTEVRLLAVTKTFPAVDVAHLLDLGLRDFAENRVPEASAKVVDLADLRPAATPRWSMVGRLQRNKARAVTGWAAEVQSVDSERLAEALARATAAAREAGERFDPLDVLIQVSMDNDPDRGGCPLDDVLGLAEKITRWGDLRLRGLMAVAPRGVPPEREFARLEPVAARLKNDHQGAAELSIGMSGDLEQAVRHGSTCVRVGTALLGYRPLASE